MKHRGRSGAGFALLKLLVAMTVLGLLTALLASSLSFGMRVWEREQGQFGQWAELQMVQDVIRRMVVQALPLFVSSTDGSEAIAFVGTNSSIAQSTIAGYLPHRASLVGSTSIAANAHRYPMPPPRQSPAISARAQRHRAVTHKVPAPSRTTTNEHIRGISKTRFSKQLVYND